MNPDKHSRVIPEPKTAKEFLSLLRNYFNDRQIDDIEHRKLWLVLSALRGPDDKKLEGFKACTTAVIRHKIFGYQSVLRSRIDIYEDQHSFMQDRMELSHIDPMSMEISSHFKQHMFDAFEALGMSVTNVNDYEQTPE